MGGARAWITLAMIGVVAAGCGSDGSNTAADDGSTTVATSTTTTTTTVATSEVSTTTTVATSTTAEESELLPTADLRFLSFEASDFGPDFVEMARDTNQTGTDWVMPTPCGETLEISHFQRSGSAYVYPGEEIGWPDPEEGTFVSVAIGPHQTLTVEENSYVDDMKQQSASCDGVLFGIEWPDAGSATSIDVEIAPLAGVDGAGYAVVTDDGSLFQQYMLTVDDLGITMSIAGYGGPESDTLIKRAAPLVAQAQTMLAECVENPACRAALG